MTSGFDSAMTSPERGPKLMLAALLLFVQTAATLLYRFHWGVRSNVSSLANLASRLHHKGNVGMWQLTLRTEMS